MVRRVLTVVLVTTALLVAGPIVARTLAIASPAEVGAEAHAAPMPVASDRARPHASKSWNVESLPDEAAMALIGTALLAAGAAMRKTA
jgi:hypothetical protein